MEIPLEKREEVRALFDSALQHEPTARSSFLMCACPDEGVRALVDELLRSYEQAGSFLSHPPINAGRLAASFGTEVFKPGELLAGRFRITRFIARGGVGEVYEAEDQELQEQVAIKTIRQDVLEQPHVVERFKREVCLARVVTHPNICRIFDLFRHQSSSLAGQDIMFVSMELLSGETLADRLRRSGRMSLAEALPIICQMASALSAAHSVGIVHRDLKPGNVILVGDDGTTEVRAVVTDFGMAFRSTDEFSVALTPGNRVVGTPEWMSPEQIEGGELTPASDIYSFGLVIYRMITGIHPFEADSPVSCALRRLTEEPLSPRKIIPDLPPRWETVVVRCLERKLSRRAASAKEVAEALAGEAVRLRPRLPKKTKLMITGIPAFLAALFIGYVMYPKAVPTRQPAWHWERQVVQSIKPEKTEIWRPMWQDIFWNGKEGWLGGTIDGGSGGGDVGRGILLHTMDQGDSWTEIEKGKFNSGNGRFHWGPHGTVKWGWREVGPIYTIGHSSRVFEAGGKRKFSIWIATTTGVYYTEDDGATWRRSTPRPDDHTEPEIYAHFFSLAHTRDSEIYATGWQGIAHWSPSTRRWELQVPTYNNPIHSVYVYYGYPYEDIWAVGWMSAPNDPFGLIYHLRQPGRVWEKLTVTGVDVQPGDHLFDIHLMDYKTGFAVGMRGMILQGSKDKDDVWTWTGRPSPTKEFLRSIEYAGDMAWIVGDNGVVLNSTDRGNTWNLSFLRDDSGQLPLHLNRVRSVGDSVWIVGDGVVYKLVKGPGQDAR